MMLLQSSHWIYQSPSNFIFFFPCFSTKSTVDVEQCNLVLYMVLLKTGSLDNAIREFSLVKPSWYMSHYTMIYKNGERMREFLGLFVVIVA